MADDFFPLFLFFFAFSVLDTGVRLRADGARDIRSFCRYNVKFFYIARLITLALIRCIRLVFFFQVLSGGAGSV